MKRWPVVVAAVIAALIVAAIAAAEGGMVPAGGAAFWQSTGTGLIRPKPAAGVYIDGTETMDGGLRVAHAAEVGSLTVDGITGLNSDVEVDGVFNATAASILDRVYVAGAGTLDGGVCFHDGTCQTTAAVASNATTPYIAADGGLQWADHGGAHEFVIAENLADAYGTGPALALLPDYSGERLKLIDRSSTVGNGYLQTQGNFRSNAALSFNSRWPQGSFVCSAPSMDVNGPAFSLAFDFSDPSTGMLLCGRKTGAGNMSQLFTVDGNGAGAFASTIAATGVISDALTAQAAGPVSITGETANGGSAVNEIFDGAHTLNILGGKLASFRNNTVEKLSVLLNGTLSSPSWAAQSTSAAGNLAFDFDTTVTKTTGNLVEVDNNGTPEFYITSSGVAQALGGFNANSQKITSVANGTASTDGVNLSQITNLRSILNGSITTTINVASVTINEYVVPTAGTIDTLDAYFTYSDGVGDVTVALNVYDVTTSLALCAVSDTKGCINGGTVNFLHSEACSGAFASGDTLALRIGVLSNNCALSSVNMTTSYK